MNKDIRLSIDFITHRKRKKLQKLLGPSGVLSLIDLWLSTARQRPSGTLTGYNEIDIELDANWDGENGVFVKTLIELGFIDEINGTYHLHNWSDRQEWVVTSDDRSDKARFSRLAKINPKVFSELKEKGVDKISKYDYKKLTETPTHVNETLNETLTVVKDALTPAPAPAPAPAHNAIINTPLPPKGKDVELKDFLLKNIPEDLSFLKNNFLEFFKYRQQKPKSKRYQSEIGINGLFRDICNCIAVGHPPVECLNIAMERGWQTPSPDYFKPEMFTKLTNGTVQETKEQILKRHGLSA